MQTKSAHHLFLARVKIGECMHEILRHAVIVDGLFLGGVRCCYFL